MTSELQQFLDAVARDRDLWEVADVRVIAAGDGAMWYNGRTRIALRTTTPTPRALVRYQHRQAPLLGVQYLYPVAELPRVLKAIESGVLETADGVIRYNEGVGREASASRLHLSTGRRSPDRTVVGGQLWSGQAVSGSSATTFSPTGRVEGGSTALDRAALSMKRPFQGVREFARHITGEGWDTGNSSVEVVAWYEAAFEDIVVPIEEDTVAFTVVVGSARAAAAVKVIVDLTGGTGGALRRVPPPPPRSWKRGRDGRWRFTFRVPVGRAQSAKMILSCGEDAIDWAEAHRYEPTSPDPILRAYLEVDPTLEKLRGCLLGKPPSGNTRQRSFEEGVQRLLSLVGWCTDWRVDDSLTEGPDIVAYSPVAGALLVVECSLGPPDRPGKTAKLLERAHAIQRQIPVSTEVLPIFATAMLRDDVLSTVREGLTHDGIHLMAQKELQQLLQWVEVGISPTFHLRYLQTPTHQPARIPRAPRR
jgi:hypothetical protein